MLKMLGGHSSYYALATKAGPLWCSELKVAFSPDHQSLFVADVHLGKAQSFRKLGVPVPSGTTLGNLQRLTQAISRFSPRTIYFLGDLLHSRAAHNDVLLTALRQWRLQHESIRMVLIRGNHDDKAGDPPSDVAIEVVSEPHPLGDFALCHHGRSVSQRVCLSGHIHPVAVLKGKGRLRFRLPCFTHKDSQIVLPAFGEFTGGYLCKAEDFEDILFVVKENG
ncbi:MAG: ligase-associated DNA damage response endonuclease PdeM [Limnobacter sp.]|nr:ligase-associated DNA damage response endonuclease PdeM [Limnobacter sp.]